MGFSIINHPFWGPPISGNPQFLEAPIYGSNITMIHLASHQCRDNFSSPAPALEMSGVVSTMEEDG
eukprot:s834_g3.t1